MITSGVTLNWLEFIDSEKLSEETIYKNFKRYTLIDAEASRKQRAAGLLLGLAHLRGGAKQAAFGSDIAPKVIILAGLECANPIFNDLFDGNGEKPSLKIDALQEIANDYESKLATKIYIGIRSGYLENEETIRALGGYFEVSSPIQAVERFIQTYLKWKSF